VLKQSFLSLYKKYKTTIVVHKNYGTDSHSSFEILGWKNCEKNNTDNVMFQFPEHVDIVVGDVLQQKNGKVLWLVHKLDELFCNNEMVYFEAKVTQLDSLQK
jgi:hypothetical protein